MKAFIVARAERMAMHAWVGAPHPREYLANMHAHVFKFEVKAPVEDMDRQIEFHDLRAALEDAIGSILEITATDWGDLPSFGDMSCEQIGAAILDRMEGVCEATVSEDGQFDAIVISSEKRFPLAHEEERPRIVTLCGSTKFEKEFREAEDRLEMDGFAVFSVGSFPNAHGIQLDVEVKAELDRLHKRKITMSDSIYVINPGGYVGDSTRSEIELARRLGIQVMSLEPLSI